MIFVLLSVLQQQLLEEHERLVERFSVLTGVSSGLPEPEVPDMVVSFYPAPNSSDSWSQGTARLESYTIGDHVAIIKKVKHFKNP